MADSNKDVLAAIETFDVKFNKKLDDFHDEFDRRISPLEQWKIGTDAAAQAIAEYKRDHNHMTGGRGVSKIDKDLLKIIAQLIALITSGLGLLYLIVQHFVQ